jgi:hypothetical protein
MLYEIKKVKQHDGEPLRRWFFDHEIDLLIWIDESDEIVGFQLCYDKINDPHALTWHLKSGYQHNRIDDGDAFEIPILITDRQVDTKTIASAFKEKSRDIEEHITAFVYEKILDYAPVE